MIKNNQNLLIIKQFAKTDFKLRYSGSILGYMWSLLKPLLIFVILNFVFSNIFGKDDPTYSLRLLISIVMWSFFAEGTMVGMTSLVSKAGILTKIALPRWTIIIALTLNSAITYVINLLIVLIFFVFYGFVPSLSDFFSVIFYSLCIYFLILTFSFFTAPLYVKFRDLNQIWEVLLTAGFYAAPIIYPISAIPAYLQWVILLNPMTFIILQVQSILFVPAFTNNLVHVLIYVGSLSILFLTSIFWFKRKSKFIMEII